MDTHSGLRQLMAERGWTAYRLAKESGLSESTLANISKRQIARDQGEKETVTDCSGQIICRKLGRDHPKAYNPAEGIQPANAPTGTEDIEMAASHLLWRFRQWNRWRRWRQLRQAYCRTTSFCGQRQRGEQPVPRDYWITPAARPGIRSSTTPPGLRHNPTPRHTWFLARDCSFVPFWPRKRTLPQPAWTAPGEPGTAVGRQFWGNLFPCVIFETHIL